MSAWRRVRAAAPVTFTNYLVMTLAALPFAAMASGAVAEATAGQPRGADAVSEPGGALLLETAEHVTRHVGGWLALALVLGGLVVLLSAPLLSVAWAAALHRPLSVVAALRVALGQYWRSLGLSAISAGVLAVALPLSMLPLLALLPISDLDDERLHEIAFVVCLLPMAVVLCTWGAATDMARAGLGAEASSLGAALSAGLRRVRPRSVGLYVLLGALGAGLWTAGAALSAALDGPGAMRVALVLLAGQAVALARAFIRSGWLAHAVGSVEPLVEEANRLRAEGAAPAAPPPAGLHAPAETGQPDHGA